MLGRQLILQNRNPSTSELEQTTIPFPVDTEATYQNINTAMRALNALSQNTYVDTLSVNTVSVNEELAS